MPTPRTAAEIQRAMRRVRCDLDHEMDDLVDNAKQITGEFTDWRSYVKANPWLFIGTAAALGYWVVPTRVMVERPVAKTLADLASTGKIKLERPAARSTLWSFAVDTGIGMASATVLQLGMGLLNRRLSQLIDSMGGQQPTRTPAETSPREN